MIAPTKKLSLADIRLQLSVENVLAMVGKHISKLAINTVDIQYKSLRLSWLEEAVRLLERYCSSGNLRELNIIIHRNHTASFATGNVLRVFQTLQKLHIECGGKNVDGFLCDILGTCHGLQSLTVVGATTSMNHLQKITNFQLNQLRYIDCTITGNEHWQTFSTGVHDTVRHFQLDCFPLRGDNSIASPNFFTQLLWTFPSVEKLVIDISMALDYTPLIESTVHSVNMVSRSTNGRDLENALMACASGNTIQHLIISMPFSYRVPYNESQFGWLECVRPWSRLQSVQLSGGVNFAVPFVAALLTNLQCNRIEVTIVSDGSIVQADLLTIINASKQLVSFKYWFCHFSAKFFDSIVKLRAGNSNKLKLYVPKFLIDRVVPRVSRFDKKKNIVSLSVLESTPTIGFCTN